MDCSAEVALLLIHHLAGACLRPFLCEMAVAEDARDGAQDLPLRKGICVVREENLTGALRLCAMKPSAEEAEIIGDDLTVGFCLCCL
jgi:hypothetical protein